MFMSASTHSCASLPGARGSDCVRECIAVMCCGMLTALYELSEPKPQIGPISKPLGSWGVAAWELFPYAKPLDLRYTAGQGPLLRNLPVVEESKRTALGVFSFLQPWQEKI